MLSYLKISNYALIEKAEIEFSPGFNVVTGESGAGKSILMSAVELLLGGRADHSVIREGSDRCEVAGCFEIPEQLQHTLKTQLEEAGINFDPEQPELQLRRVIGIRSGRNFINDTPVGGRLLAQIGVQLVDLHGANEQLSLLSPARQLELLDRYAGANELLEQCKQICDARTTLQKQLEEFNRNLPDEAERAQLEQLIEDISRVNPSLGEDEELSAKHRLGTNSKQVIETAGALANALTEADGSIADQLGFAYRQLQSLAQIGASSVDKLLDECSAIQESVSTLSSGITDLVDQVDLDADALAKIETRLGEIFTLKRRYGPSIEQVLEARTNAEQRLKDYQEARQRREEFEQQAQELNLQLRTTAEQLSALRKKASDKFSREVQSRLASIGFKQCQLLIGFEPTLPGPTGMDKIEFMFSANTGESPRPLRRIASSGELSRLMLALKTVLADADAIPMVVFDEIDANIGGETANRLGLELKNLGRNRQVLCISHQALVAAKADRHFRVDKHSAKGRTFSETTQLDQAGREQELARMLGGGTSALAHARSILSAD